MAAEQPDGAVRPSRRMTIVYLALAIGPFGSES